MIEQIHLIDRVRKLNNAYSRLISTGAAATDSKIRFELATHTPQGRPLMVAGMNRMDFGAKELNTEDFVDFYQDGEFDWSAFFKFYEADWDPNKFLNIWILPTGKVKIPSYVPSVIQAGKAPLKGLKMNEVDEYYIPKLTECGIVINYSSFLNVKMNAVIGKFLGLLPTSNASGTVGGDSDYCSDTFLYSKDESKEERKQGLNQPISFISDNIMDETTQDISVTNEQAERMNYILENVPTRRMWKVAE